MSCHKNLCVICETDSNELADFTVLIYDCNNKLIIKKKTETFRHLCIPIMEQGTYKIVVCPPDEFSPSKAVRWVSLRPQCNDMEFFKFNRRISLPRMCNACFYIRDAMYSQMPVSKGVLYLWHRIFQ